MTIPYEIRPLRFDVPSEPNYVRKTWIASRVRALPRAEKERFLRLQPRIITALLARSTTLLAVAPSDGDTRDEYLGYIVGDPRWPMVHYVYVKNVFRRLGIGRRLLRELLKNEHRRVTVTDFIPNWIRQQIEKRNWTIDVTHQQFITLEHEAQRPMERGGHYDPGRNLQGGHHTNPGLVRTVHAPVL